MILALRAKEKGEILERCWNQRGTRVNKSRTKRWGISKTLSTTEKKKKKKDQKWTEDKVEIYLESVIKIAAGAFSYPVCLHGFDPVPLWKLLQGIQERLVRGERRKPPWKTSFLYQTVNVLSSMCLDNRAGLKWVWNLSKTHRQRRDFEKFWPLLTLRLLIS